MLPVANPQQLAEADRRAIAAGTPEEVLVRRAGTAVAWHARRMLGGTYGRRVVVVCGKGNNGADGAVAAEVLRSWGVRVDVVRLVDAHDSRALRHALDRCDLVIDAMFGTGFRGELDGVAAVIDAELYRAPWILAVDIPSGVDGATGAIRGHGLVGGAVLAHETITFVAHKPGLLFEPGRFHAGTVHVVDIGIDPGPVDCVLWTAADAATAPLERWPDAHKWSRAVLVVGGSRGMTGAPMLAARAAQRAGAGMVVAAVPGRDAATHASGSEVVVRAAADDDGQLVAAAVVPLLDEAARFAAAVVGPGAGRAPDTAAALCELVARLAVPVVVDADALHALGAHPEVLERRRASGLPPTVLTPHAGEFAALMGAPVGDDRVAAARALARTTGAVVVLKGPGSVIAGPDGRAAICANAGSELASPGTGDVLAGIVAAFVAGHGRDVALADAWSATASAVWAHGDAGAHAANGPSTIAGDVVGELPRTLARLRRCDLLRD